MTNAAKRIAVCLRACRDKRNEQRLIRVAEEMIEALLYYAPSWEGNAKIVRTDDGYRANSAITELLALGIDIEGRE